MTCWLTGHDDRFKAGVAGGVVSDMTSMYGTCDDGPCMSAYELGGSPWERPEAVRRDVAADARRPGEHADARAARARRPDLPGRPGPAVAHHPARARRADRAGALPRRLARVRAARAAVAADRLRHAGWSTGSSATPGTRAARGSTSPTGSSGWPGSRSGTASPVPSSASCASTPTACGRRRARRRVVRPAEHRHRAPVTPESIFQIGSITKVWTATVVMQLVDEGLLDLDAPVVEVLPELRLADPDVTKHVTVRHLLNHTSGIDGDVFTDTGRGDDCIERYVELLAEQTQNHPLGATWSYCNAGFSVLGRVIEVLTEQTWDAALRERLFTPLQMQHAITLPEEALLHAAAVGHVTEDGHKQVAPVWQLPRSIGPAGLVSANAADVLAFARLHLTGGLGPDGERVLGAGVGRGDGRPPGRPARQVLARRLVGPGLDPLRLGRRAPLRPRRQHDRAGGLPAGAARRRSRGDAADQQRRQPRPLRGPLPRGLRRAGRRRDAAPADPAGAARRRRPRAVRRPLPARLGADGGASRATRGRRCARRSAARSPSWCRTRSTSTGSCPTAPACG